MNDQTHLGPKTLFVIYTEDTDREAIVKIVSKEFSSATLHPGQIGLWHGTEESSLSIEIIGHESSRGAVLKVAAEIKSHNRQEAVMVTEVLLANITMI